MAELADAPDLGSGAQCVGVQVPPTAPLRGSGSVVELRLAKAKVASSNLVFRSNITYYEEFIFFIFFNHADTDKPCGCSSVVKVENPNL